jgi:hypothetical protein
VRKANSDFDELNQQIRDEVKQWNYAHYLQVYLRC